MNERTLLNRVFGLLPLSTILDSGHMAALRFGTTGVNLVFGIVGARLLGTDEFGEYVAIFAIAGLMGVASSAGLPLLLQREISISRGNLDTKPLIPLVHGLLVINTIAVVLLFCSIVFASESVKLVFLFVIVSNFIGVLTALYFGYERVLLGTWISNIARPLCALILLWPVCWLFAPSASSAMWSQIGGTGIAILVAVALWREPFFMFLRKALASKWWSTEHWVQLKTGLVFAVTQVVINLKTQADIFVLILLADSTAVAFYYAASRAALVVWFYSGATFLMAEPRLTRLFAANEISLVRTETKKIAMVAFWGTLIAGVFAVALARPYLGLYGPEFSAALPAMVLLIFGFIIRSGFGPALAVLRAARQDGAIFSATLVSVLVNVALCLALIPHFGILGAAIGGCVQAILNEAWLAFLARNRAGVGTHIFANTTNSTIDSEQNELETD